MKYYAEWYFVVFHNDLKKYVLM